MKELYGFLGFTEEEFKNKIKPYIERTMKKGGSIDVILLKLNSDTTLTSLDKVYCAYVFGRTMGKFRR